MARFVPMKEAEERFSVDWFTLRRWIDQGKITGFRFGDRKIYLDLDELEAFMKPIPVGGDHDATG
jgi:excisionase family DNA binding protein